VSTSNIAVTIYEKLASVVNLVTAALPKPYIDVRDYPSFADAVTAIGSAKKTLLIPSEQAVSANITIPSNIELYFLQGGSLSIATGVTVTINGQVNGGLYQIFSWSGSGKVVFGAGAVKEVYPQWWGAKADAATDDTAAIQAAIDCAEAMPKGGVVYFPPGTYRVTSLDLSSVTGTRHTARSIKLIGAGRKATRIEGTQNGAILIDALGRLFMTIDDMDLGTDGTAVYQTGILLARMQGSESEQCILNSFHRLYVRGEFSVASVVKIAVEVDLWQDCVLENDDPTNNYCTLFTGRNNDVAGVSSTHGTIMASSNTDNSMLECTFVSEHDNAQLIIFDEAASYNFFGCDVTAGNHTGIIFAKYIAGFGGNTFYGRVNWVGTLWEAADGVVHYLTTPAVSVGYYHDISDIGSSFTLYGSPLVHHAMADDGKVSVVENCRIENALLSSTNTMKIELDYAIGCHFDIWSQFIPSIIQITSGRSYSFFRAQTLLLPADDSGFAIQAEVAGGGDAFGTALPTDGTWKRGVRYWKTLPAASASPGWHCVTSGTYSTATDNTGDTDGSTAVITGMTDTSDFNIGDYVTVSAGFPTTGPYRIVAKTASSITLEVNSTSIQSNITVETPDPVWAAMPNLLT